MSRPAKRARASSKSVCIKGYASFQKSIVRHFARRRIVSPNQENLNDFSDLALNEYLKLKNEDLKMVERTDSGGICSFDLMRLRRIKGLWSMKNEEWKMKNGGKDSIRKIGSCPFDLASFGRSKGFLHYGFAFGRNDRHFLSTCEMKKCCKRKNGLLWKR